MKLLIVRHAPAGDAVAFAKTGKPDSTRPLTPKGRAKMRKAASGLRRVMKSIDLLTTSPLARARETAEILAKEYGLKIQTTTALSPDAPQETLMKYLADRSEASVCVVSHEPALGRLIAKLLTGEDGCVTTLKKGQACLLEMPGRSAAGTARLAWSLTPSQLRKLG